MKEKMLLKLERDRLAQKNEGLQKSLQNVKGYETIEKYIKREKEKKIYLKKKVF